MAEQTARMQGVLGQYDKPHVITGATTLRQDQRRVYAEIPSSGTYEIQLPPVGECPWAEFMVMITATNGGTSVTVDDQDDSRVALAAITLDAVEEYTLIKNIGGETYAEIASNHA